MRQKSDDTCSHLHAVKTRMMIVAWWKTIPQKRRLEGDGSIAQQRVPVCMRVRLSENFSKDRHVTQPLSQPWGCSMRGALHREGNRRGFRMHVGQLDLSFFLRVEVCVKEKER